MPNSQKIAHNLGLMCLCAIPCGIYLGMSARDNKDHEDRDKQLIELEIQKRVRAELEIERLTREEKDARLKL